MEYLAIAEKYTDFKITKDGIQIATLNYKNWFKFNAEIEISNSKYLVEPIGFWGTTVEVLDGKKILLKFTINWGSNIIIETYFDDEKSYIFKHRGFFNESFVLTDQKGSELLMMKPNFKWNNLNYGYKITTTSIFESLNNKNILLLNSLHCANYYMSIMAGMG